ncbi:MAG: ABC-type Mn2+/Zn2+ transport system permease subunit [Planctomycetota bacterium]|jgi:ABC-type Mn2+/Zn2+ transport system permease subunit
MNEFIASLENHAASYVATMGIALLCSYLGVFTVLRRIVFTGVALAQLAAAGVAASFFVADSAFFSTGIRTFAANYGSTLGSLGLTVLGALGLEARPGRSRISTDALVGIVFAASSSLSILMVWGSARGLAELKNILAGDVLLSRPEELFLLWFGIIAVALVHGKMRRQFLLVSFDPEFARSIRVPVHRYQMILMATLAVAIALALRIAGLLLVFSFLVIPPIAGLRLGKKLGTSTIFAMSVAIGSTLLGYAIAILEDLPIAASVAASQVVFLLLAFVAPINVVVKFLIQTIVSLAAIAALVLVVIVMPMPTLGEGGGANGHAHGGAAPTGPSRDELLAEALSFLANGTTPAERVKAAQDLAELSDSRSVTGLCTALVDEDDDVKAAVGKALAAIGDMHGTGKKLKELVEGSDPEFRILGARAMVLTGNKDGITHLIKALVDGEAPPFMIQDTLIPYLQEVTGKNFGYDIFGEEAAQKKALSSWQSWWKSAKDVFTLPKS